MIDLIGYIAATLTTLSFLPQVIKAWRSRSVADLSALWIICFASGVGLWLIYGLMVEAMPIILANAVTLTLVLMLARLKWLG